MAYRNVSLARLLWKIAAASQLDAGSQAHSDGQFVLLASRSYCASLDIPQIFVQGAFILLMFYLILSYFVLTPVGFDSWHLTEDCIVACQRIHNPTLHQMNLLHLGQCLLVREGENHFLSSHLSQMLGRRKKEDLICTFYMYSPSVVTPSIILAPGWPPELRCQTTCLT